MSFTAPEPDPTPVEPVEAPPEVEPVSAPVPAEGSEPTPEVAASPESAGDEPVGAAPVESEPVAEPVVEAPGPVETPEAPVAPPVETPVEPEPPTETPETPAAPPGPDLSAAGPEAHAPEPITVIVKTDDVADRVARILRDAADEIEQVAVAARVVDSHAPSRVGPDAPAPYNADGTVDPVA